MKSKTIISIILIAIGLVGLLLFILNIFPAYPGIMMYAVIAFIATGIFALFSKVGPFFIFIGILFHVLASRIQVELPYGLYVAFIGAIYGIFEGLEKLRKKQPY